MKILKLKADQFLINVNQLLLYMCIEKSSCHII